MKQHLNTLFVTLDDAYLAKQGEAVLVRVEKQTKLRLTKLTSETVSLPSRERGLKRVTGLEHRVVPGRSLHGSAD